MNGVYAAFILADRLVNWILSFIGAVVMVVMITVAGVTIVSPPPSRPPQVVNMAWDPDATTAETVVATAWLKVADFEIYDLLVCKIAHDTITDTQLVGVWGEWYIL